MTPSTANEARRGPVRDAPAAARPQLRIAPDLARRRRRARLAMWAAAVFTAGALLTVVTFHVLAAQSAFTLDHLAQQRTNEQLRYQRLRDEVARLSSPGTVVAEARKLGMAPASQVPMLAAPAVTPVATPTTAPLDRAPQTLRSWDDTKKHLDGNP